MRKLDYFYYIVTIQKHGNARGATLKLTTTLICLQDLLHQLIMLK